MAARRGFAQVLYPTMQTDAAFPVVQPQPIQPTGGIIRRLGVAQNIRITPFAVGGGQGLEYQTHVIGWSRAPRLDNQWVPNSICSFTCETTTETFASAAFGTIRPAEAAAFVPDNGLFLNATDTPPIIGSAPGLSTYWPGFFVQSGGLNFGQQIIVPILDYQLVQVVGIIDQVTSFNYIASTF